MKRSHQDLKMFRNTRDEKRVSWDESNDKMLYVKLNEAVEQKNLEKFSEIVTAASDQHGALIKF